MSRFMRAVALGLALAAGLAAVGSSRLLACDTAVGVVTSHSDYGDYSTCEDAEHDGKVGVENGFYVGYRITPFPNGGVRLTVYYKD
jgi:hypothetical protein